MIGSQQIVITAEEFLKGMSIGAQVSDAGFSPESDAINLLAVPGLLHYAADHIDSDTDVRLTGGIIASSPDMVSFAGTNRLLIAANGSYYTYNGTKIPAVALQTDGVNTYVGSFCDIITYAGEAYVTTKEKIIRWQNPSTFNNSFASFTNTNRPHPAIVFEDNAFYGDKNLLLRQTSAGGAPATILTLSSDQEIIALGIDQGTGRMLIATTNSLNMSGTLPGIFKLHWYDGFSNKTLKTVQVDSMITAFYSLGAVTYVGYGQNLGYINGSGISFLRKLNNVTLDLDQLPYKHRICSIGNTLYVVDGAQILAYGEVLLKGPKIFYYCYNNQLNSNKIQAIFNAGSNKLGICFATNKFFTLDVTSVSPATYGAVFKSNWYHFPRPVFLRELYIEFNSAGNTNNLTFSYSDQQSSGNGLSAENGQTVTSALEMSNFVGFTNIRVKSVKLSISFATSSYGIRKIILFYDYAD